MALKQVLFADDAFDRLPSLIQLIQSGTLPENELSDIFSHVSTLIYGTLQQKKIGLAVLKCCLVHLHRSNKISDNIDYMLKWWKGVVNCVKSRYTADTAYRLACVNATILSQTCGNYVDLLMEGRANIPVLVSACTTHVCKESFDLLLVLTRMFPSHTGKHYEAIKALCLLHVQDEHSAKCAEILSLLTCIGPAGKQSVNYTQSWNKAIVSCFHSVNKSLCAVVGQEGGSDSVSVLPHWQFNGTLDDVFRANKEITFLAQYTSHLLNMTLDVSTLLPLKSLKGMIESVSTAYSESLMYVGTADNFSRKLVINHAVKEVLSVLISIVPVLNTTVFLIQPEIEKLLCNLLKHSCHVSHTLELLSVMIDVGCTLTSLPPVLLLDVLSLNSLQIKGPVTKKQKTEQFNTFTFETSTLGSHREDDMVCVLRLLCQILRSAGTRLPQLKLDVLKEKCEDIIAHKECFSNRVLQHTYQILNTLSCQTFNFPSVLTLCSSVHNPSLQKFFSNEIISVEPHLHPERHSFSVNSDTRDTSNVNSDVSIEITQLNGRRSLWEDKEEALFVNMPHRAAVNGTDVHMEEEKEEKEEEDEEGEEMEEKNVSSESEEEEDSSDKTFTVIPSSDITKSHTSIDNNTSGKQVSGTVKTSSDTDVNIKENIEPAEKGEKSAALFDILSSFVDEPPSGDEMCV